MRYRVIGTMSGSSLDGLDIVYAEIEEAGGKWSYSIPAAECIPYDNVLAEKLRNATRLSAEEYLLLHAEYGHFTGKCITSFIGSNGLEHNVQLIASHGHTSFHLPGSGMTAQLGDGSAIAAETGLPVVSDLRALDVALGGQGAPIVPIGEKMLFGDYGFLLNIGGIANMTIAVGDQYQAYDVCVANQLLNALAGKRGKPFDENGSMAASGTLHEALFLQLSKLGYYQQHPPKSLDNQFSKDRLMPLIEASGATPEDALCTFVQHICERIAAEAISAVQQNGRALKSKSMLVTGGGAFNGFLTDTLGRLLSNEGIELVIPDAMTVKYKEALIMGLLGILRWREEPSTLAGVTGARANSIGGAVWMGAQH